MGDILHQSPEPQTPENFTGGLQTDGTTSGQLSQIENDKHELRLQMMDRVGSLESRNLKLREQLRQVEADKRYIETQKIRYEREVRKLRARVNNSAAPR